MSEETTGSGGVSDTQLIDNVWRPAEAYHFYILAQTQYKMNMAEAALKSALTLTEYEDIVPVQTIYNLIGEFEWKSTRLEMHQLQFELVSSQELNLPSILFQLIKR